MCLIMRPASKKRALVARVYISCFPVLAEAKAVLFFVCPPKGRCWIVPSSFRLRDIPHAKRVFTILGAL